MTDHETCQALGAIRIELASAREQAGKAGALALASEETVARLLGKSLRGDVSSSELLEAVQAADAARMQAKVTRTFIHDLHKRVLKLRMKVSTGVEL
jgi:hypothetical protein